MPGLLRPSWPLPLLVCLLHPWPPTRTIPSKALYSCLHFGVCLARFGTQRRARPPLPEQLCRHLPPPCRQTNGVN